DLEDFLPHHANILIYDALVRALELPDSVAVARDIITTGNTSAASIPLAMDRMLASGEIHQGGNALLVGFGAGLVFASEVVTLP
ncbi:MAG: 3-oxoacyl-[acyl-carrier-protein] synthase III C-terminal domain-containing protein, partial [Actinomycetota bacterium]